MQRASWNHPLQTHQDNGGGGGGGKTVRHESSTSRSFESSGSGSGHLHGHHGGHGGHGGGHEAAGILYSNPALGLGLGYEEEPREEYDQHGVRIENQVVIDF